MRRQCIISLGDQFPHAVSWLKTADAESPVENGSGTLEDLRETLTGCQVIVLVPASEILLTTAEIPSKSKPVILNALPHVLEDHLAGEIELFHFALGLRDDGFINHAAVVDKVKMSFWIDAFRAAGIEPDLMFPDVLYLPVIEDRWSVVLSPTIALVRTGTQSGFAVDRDNFEFVLAIALKQLESNQPSMIDIYYLENAEKSELKLEDFEINHVEMSDDFLPAFIEGFSPKKAINLLQGDYSRREQITRYIRPWVPAISMCLVIMMISMGTTISNYYQLDQRKNEIAENIKKIYFDACPGKKRLTVSREKNLMNQCLKELGGKGNINLGSGYLDLISGAGSALSQAGELSITRISYRDGLLDLRLSINSRQDLDQLTQDLKKQSGFSVEIQSTTVRNDKVEARLQLKDQSV